jgi:hypothetical protein
MSTPRNENAFLFDADNMLLDTQYRDILEESI